MTKLKDFLDNQKIDTRRVLMASKQIESLKDEDRAIQLARRAIKGAKPTDADKALAEKKRRSGKPVTRPLLDKALGGKTMSNAAKARITRAINRVLAAKKKSEITAGDLF